MKAGFLLQQEEFKKRHPVRVDSAQEAHSAAASAAQAAPPPPRAPAAAAAATPEQAAAGLAECLQLLKGPNDERRFVGLLLVTKLLPAGDAESVRQVHAAVGPTFLTRLLLPLKSTPVPAPTSRSGGSSNSSSHEAAAAAAAVAAAQKEAATCALGLAVLSSFARVPDLAASPDMLERLPLLLNVVRAGGIAPLLAARHAASLEPGSGGGAGGAHGAQGAKPQAHLPAELVAEPAADAAAMEDALECAVAVACASVEGAAVAADCGAVGAAVAALRACPPAAPQRLSLGLQLLAAVLGDEQRRVALLAGDQALVLQQLLPALARVFAMPAQQLTAGGSSGQKGEGEQLQRRLLAVQLEALHVLLLLLPLPQAALGSGPASLSPRAAASVAAEESSGGGSSWPAQLRQGLALLLRGRISAVQRHSALQLAAAVVDLQGPGWLLGAGSASGSGSFKPGPAAAAAAGQAEAFFQLLVEVTKVETSVLLHDALAPDVPVPLASAPAPAAGDWRPPALRHAPVPGSSAASDAGSSEAGGDGNHALGAELAADLAGGDGQQGASGAPQDADMEPLVRVLSSEEDRRQLAAQLQQEQEAAAAAAAAAGGGGGGGAAGQGEHMRRVDATPMPTEMHWEGPTEPSGARAARVLPCCFALLEACVEALAADTQRAEALMAMEEEAEEEEEDIGSATPAGAGHPQQQQGPVLSDAVAHRALFSLQEAVEVVLQYIEQTAAGDQGAGRSAGWDEQQAGMEDGMEEGAGRQPRDASSVCPPLLLAAQRVVSRFCAEVPDAFGARLRLLLPHLLSLRLDLGGGSSGGSSGSWEEGAGGAAPPGPAEGTTFLLPVLLQVTDPALAADRGSEQQREGERERQQWLDALAQPAVLRQLARYARDCAASCAPAVTAAAAAAADDALVYACQLLLNILAGEEQQEQAQEQAQGRGRGLASSQGTGQQAGAAAEQRQRQRRRQLLQTGEALPLLRGLLKLASMQPLLALPECSEVELANLARLLSALAALCGIIAASVAEEVAHPSSSSPSPAELDLGLLLSPEGQQQQEAWEVEQQQEGGEEEEQRASRHLHRRLHGFLHSRQATAEEEAAADAEPALGTWPSLGPISGRLMQALCVELLASIRIAAQLCVPGMLGGSGSSGEEWRQLASMVAGDVALQLELHRQLGVAAAEAAALLRHYPPFEAMCEEQEWLGAQLATVGHRLGREGSSADAEAGPPGLRVFLSTLADVSLG